MTLCVVIVTYNSSNVITGCLDSVREALLGIDARVIVVDNASTDKTAELVRSGPWDVTLLPSGGNIGYAAAINLAVAHARPDDDLLVLNPDVRLEPDCIARLLAPIAGERSKIGPRVGILAPRLVAPEGTDQPSRRREPSLTRVLGEAVLGASSRRLGPLWSEVIDEPAHTGPDIVDWASGAVLLVRAECRRAVGRWDESYFLYSEETDYCLRARDLGWTTLFVPEAVATHIGGDSDDDPRLHALLTHNRALLVRRRRGEVVGAGFLTALMLGELVRAAVGRRASREAVLVLLGLKPPLRASASADVSGRAAPVADVKASSAPVVLFAASDWWYHSRAHSDLQMVVQIARTRPVLVVNSIGLRMPTRANTSQPLARVWRKVKSTARLVRRPLPDTPGLHVLSPLVVPFYSVPVLRRLNAILVRTQVVVSCRALGIRRPAVIVTLPTAWDVVTGMDTAAVIYNRSDKHSEFPEADREMMLDLEGQLLRGADAVLYVSRHLMAEERDIVGGRSVFLDHGVDLEHFRPDTGEPLPAEVANLPRPVIGFFGAFDDYTVDLSLLHAVARRFPEATLLLIGPTNMDLTELTRLPNITYLGPRPYEEIPRYGRAFDVALMPWLDNEWIRACNPIKCKEYLALGLAVVTTDYPEAHAHGDVLRIARDHEDFLAGVAEVLEGRHPTPEQCRAAVADAAWSVRAAQLVSLVDAVGCR